MPASPNRFCSYPGCSELVKQGMCEKHRTRKRYCKQPGCNQIITDGSWCSEHDPKNISDKRRGSASKRGYNRAWSRVRGAYIKAHPLCELCEQRGDVRAAVLVHHIKPIADGGEVLKWDNLQALCRNCHSRVHSQLKFKEN